MRLAVLLLLVLPALAGPGALVSDLGAADMQRRIVARTRLMQLGEEAWLALAAAQESLDPEVRGQARRILRAWGWIAPEHLHLLTPARLNLLRGSSGKSRARAFEEIVRLGPRGVAALEQVYDTLPLRFQIEERNPAGHRETGSQTIEFWLRNVSGHPGWAGPVPLRSTLEKSVPFGRRVVFPAKVSIGCGFGGCGGCIVRGRGGRRNIHVNTAIQMEWIRAGERLAEPRRLAFGFSDAGLWTYRIATVAGNTELRVHVVSGGKTIIPNTLLRARVTSRVSSRVFAFAVLPPKRVWGKAAAGILVRTKLGNRDLRLSLHGDPKPKAPRDLSSAWFAALDSGERVVAHGPLDGGSCAVRVYAPAELAPAAGLVRSFRRPAVPGAVALLVGLPFDGGTAVSRRILLSDVLE